MNIIGAGQPNVTAASAADDACPLCGWWTCRCGQSFDATEFDTIAGQDALRDIVEDLVATANGDVDEEDVAHYKRLLAAPIVRLARRTVELEVAA